MGLMSTDPGAMEACVAGIALICIVAATGMVDVTTVVGTTLLIAWDRADTADTADTASRPTTPEDTAVMGADTPTRVASGGISDAGRADLRDASAASSACAAATADTGVKLGADIHH